MATLISGAIQPKLPEVGMDRFRSRDFRSTTNLKEKSDKKPLK